MPRLRVVHWGNDAADTSVDLGALEWNGTMENVGLRDDFTTAIDPLVWEPLYSQGGSYTASIVSGRLRVTGSGYVGKQYVRSVASFSAEAGRYVKAAINVSSASPSARRNLYLIGANEYAFEPVLAYLGEDGEGYPINGPGIRFTNAAGATSEHNFGALGSNSGIVVVEFTDATHVNVYNGSTLCAQLTLDPGATFDVALGLTSTSTTGVTSECDWIETGR